MTAPSVRAGSDTAAGFPLLKAISKEPANYEYINARLRARTREFLPPETFPALVRETVAGIEKKLVATPYAPVYNDLSLRSNSSAAYRLEDAVTTLTVRRFADLSGWSRGEAHLMTLLLSVRSDLQNSYLCLRSFRTGRSDFRPIPGCGELTPDFWRELSSARGIESAASVCLAARSPRADMLLDALRHSGAGSEAEWQLMKDSFVYAAVIAARCTRSRRLAAEYLERLIDLANMRTRLALLVSQGSPRYLDGGSLSVESLLFARDWKPLLRGTAWQRAAQGEGGVPSMNALEHAFLRWQIGLRLQDPLGPQVMIAYTARLRAEWHNLLSLIAGAEYGLDAATLMSALFID